VSGGLGRVDGGDTDCWDMGHSSRGGTGWVPLARDVGAAAPPPDIGGARRAYGLSARRAARALR
jgi:hypothetical protein